MSQHHRAAHWTTHAPRLRTIIKAALPLPCVDCGRLVHEEDSWQVGHLPGHDMAITRSVSLEDVGPSHSRCNQSAGGKAGARVTNAKHNTDRGMPTW